MKKNKILLFVLAIILLAGIIVVCLKGFKVSLDLRAHDTLKFVFDQKFKMSDITKVCDEVFKKKEYEVKTVEVFSDAIYVISPEITEKEQEALLEKLDKLYKTEEVSDESSSEETEDTEEETTIFEKLEEGTKYDFYHDSKVRIRDIIKPYIIPSCICTIIIAIYIGIRYNKLGNGFLIVLKTIGEMLVVLLEVMSIIAITRIPFTHAVVPIVMFIVVICLCIKLYKYEKKLEKINE